MLFADLLLLKAAMKTPESCVNLEHKIFMITDSAIIA